MVAASYPRQRADFRAEDQGGVTRTGPRGETPLGMRGAGKLRR